VSESFCALGSFQHAPVRFNRLSTKFLHAPKEELEVSLPTLIAQFLLLERIKNYSGQNRCNVVFDLFHNSYYRHSRVGGNLDVKAYAWFSRAFLLFIYYVSIVFDICLAFLFVEQVCRFL